MKALVIIALAVAGLAGGHVEAAPSGCNEYASSDGANNICNGGRPHQAHANCRSGHLSFAVHGRRETGYFWSMARCPSGSTIGARWYTYT